jgi:hypothetical protein
LWCINHYWHGIRIPISFGRPLDSVTSIDMDKLKRVISLLLQVFTPAANEATQKKYPIQVEVLRGIVSLFALSFSLQAYAIPVVQDGYSVELYAQGIGSVTGITQDRNGTIYAADYSGGRVLKITDKDDVSEFSTGLSFLTDLTFTDSGRLFASSGSGNIFELATDGSFSVLSSGFSAPTSIGSWDNDLFVSNSGDGSILKISASGNVDTLISGLSSPNGPYGISFDHFGNMYYVDHLSGAIFRYDVNGNTLNLGSVSAFGGTFTGIGFDQLLLISDVNTGSLNQLGLNGSMSVFVSGFEGKSNPPTIGPNDFIYDDSGNLFVGDGDNIWKISRDVPEPSILALILTGVFSIGVARRKERIQ